MKLKTDNIFQITELEAVPSRVYQALMNSQEHAAFTGMEVAIDPKVGGIFETFDHEASGMFLDLERDKRIVQAWRHTEFPAGFYSVVHIDLEPTEKGTRVNFNHIGVPEESSGWLTEAWKKVYWNRLKDFLDEKVLH